MKRNNLLLLLGLSLVITLTGLSMSYAGPAGVLREWAGQPLLIPLNFWPVFAVALLFTFVFGNLFAGCFVAGAIQFFLTYVNRLKMEGRDDVLVAQDISLVREAAQAARDYQLNMHGGMIALALCVLVLIAAAGFLCKKEPEKMTIPVRCAGAAVTLVVFFLTLKPVYFNFTIFNSLQKENEFHLTQVYDQLGFDYCVLHYSGRNTVSAVAEYSRGEVEAWIAEYDAQKETNTEPFTPNIVIIMCEAFSDFCDEEFFAYTDETNPIRDYHEIADDENSVSGHIIVTNYGAGTTNTEFDVMTGMQAGELRASSVFREVRKETDNILTVLDGYGYHPYFMHPGDDWFYNRKNVYRYFGIEDQFYNWVLTDPELFGGLASDREFAKLLEEHMETRVKEGDAPLFAYTTTIENHFAYPADKYSEGLAELPLNVDLSDASASELQTYFTGLRHGAEMLKEVVDYFEDVDEPVIVVFFGDHRGNVNDSYEELGVMERISSEDPADILWSYSAPYLIHVNSAYAKEKDFAAIRENLDLPADGNISDNFLPEILLEMSVTTDNTPWFTFLGELRRRFPVLRGWQNLYVDIDGNVITEPEGDDAALTDRFNKWEYYILKDS